jgi:hypothetical protein
MEESVSIIPALTASLVSCVVTISLCLGNEYRDRLIDCFGGYGYFDMCAAIVFHALQGEVDIGLV